ncbi:MAG TPA: VOC family protein [Miltoncostaeaceae bacterium]|nr:VOC family protein [Miltoncostaeaceae bacterium]
MNALFADVPSARLPESRDFYARLLEMEVVFDSDWYVLLRDPRRPRLQLAFVAHDHESVPAAFRGPARGLLITAEVDDVEGVHGRAREMGATIAQELRDEEFGQRHFMAVDPNGLLVDVYEPIPFSAAFLEANPAQGTRGAVSRSRTRPLT